MPWSGSGAFTRVYGSTGWTDDKNAAIKILASRHDTHDQDLADGINATLARNNESKPTADFRPNADATYSLGSSALRWINAWISSTLKFRQASFEGSLVAATLTANRTYTLPDADINFVDRTVKGADIASAGTTDLGAVAGFFHDITGTTTITSFGTVVAGTVKRLKFEGALTLTHNATSLILPGAANIPIQINDCIDLISEGSGNWRVTNYEPAVRVAGMVLLETQTASASAVLDFTKLSADYLRYVFTFDNVIPATNAVDLWMRHSTDAGSSFLSASYLYTVNAVTSTAPSTLTGASSVNDAKIVLQTSLASASAGTNGSMELNTNALCNCEWRLSHISSGGSFDQWWGSGIRNTSGLNAIRFLMSSGNITSGVIRMYGMRK